ncbi:MAG: iron-containing alcohol dehydrogenase, partial [Planctomycetales bacterium]|nr:iron-containing alcohol dehydrogenase [Planctomycetales bacterium]
VAHAIESYVSKPRNSASMSFSREAWRLLADNFSKVLVEPMNLDARGAMQLGACFAGLAIENSMLGATHALANPLTAHFGLVHGQAIAIMLPHVIRYNGSEFPEWYRELAQIACLDDSDGVAAVADQVVCFAQHAQLATTLGEIGVDADKLPELAADAAKQWTGTFNPRPVTQESLLALYQAAM